MARYNNPLPHAQVPPSQGRPAQGGHHPQHPQPHYNEPALSGWPPVAPQGQAPNGGHRPAPTPSYPDLGYPDHDAPQHDPYAALRPDGYGGVPQPSGVSDGDPYGLAGYTAPKGAAPGFGQRQAPPASYDPYAAPADPYGAPAQPGGGGYQQPGQGGGYVGQQAVGRGAPHAPAGGGYAPPPASAPSFNDYAMPHPGGFGALHADAPASHGDQWGGHDPHSQSLGLDPQDYAGQDAYADPHGHGQWGMDGYGSAAADPQLGHDPYQAQHGALDQSYADDDAMYDEVPARKGWKKVAVLMACTVLVGGGLSYGLSGLMGSGGGEAPPLVKGAEGPSKVKPSEPGGKRFDHADSKIMGRLGEGGSSNDASGVRRVPVVQVGRDGSIRPPPSGRETQAITSVPGLTVIDNFGGAPNSGRSESAGGSPAVAGPSPTRSAQPKVKMVTGSDDRGSSAAQEKAAAPASPPQAKKSEAPKKVAAATPSASSSSSSASSGPRPTGAGYVAVLASVPASASSRIDALTQFADMQQQYGNILSNKTPDIQEANLGAKGTYHRLLVGPPGSRDSANSVCNQLKAQGYSGCWITAY